jgi:hypothetical protein
VRRKSRAGKRVVPFRRALIAALRGCWSHTLITEGMRLHLDPSLCSIGQWVCWTARRYCSGAAGTGWRVRAGERGRDVWSCHRYGWLWSSFTLCGGAATRIAYRSSSDAFRLRHPKRQCRAFSVGTVALQHPFGTDPHRDRERRRDDRRLWHWLDRQPRRQRSHRDRWRPMVRRCRAWGRHRRRGERQDRDPR